MYATSVNPVFEANRVSSRTPSVHAGSNSVGFFRDNTMKRISLTQGKFALVDDEDFERINQYKWYAGKNKRTYYAGRHFCSRTTIRMHRVIMNAPKGMEVDHRDGNGLNNCKGNLRFCTQSQNQQNQQALQGGTSLYKGVSSHTKDKKWRACITLNSKTYYLGNFYNEIKAALAYDEKAKELFGEFAYLNFPETNGG